MATNKITYQAVCGTCYTCVVGEGTKKQAQLAATSHMGAYGHNVSIIYFETAKKGAR